MPAKKPLLKRGKLSPGSNSHLASNATPSAPLPTESAIRNSNAEPHSLQPKPQAIAMRRLHPPPPPASSGGSPMYPQEATPSSRNTSHPNAIQPSQFLRAVQMINAMVSSERAQAERESGRGRSAGWVTLWRERPQGGPQKESFLMQPVWCLSDGESIAVVDFNGTDVHHNYKENMKKYMAERAEQQRPPSDGSPPGMAIWLEIDILNDFKTSGALPLAPNMLAALVLREPANKTMAWAVAGSTQKLDAHVFHFCKPKALVLLLRGAPLVQSVLEEMCNGYLPPFMEDSYPSGVRFEGRWCSPAQPPRVGAKGPGRHSPHPTLQPPTVHRLCCPVVPEESSPELSAAEAAVWHDLFPAVEAARQDALRERELGAVALPPVIVEEMQEVIQHKFPVYTALPRSAPPSSTSPAPQNVLMGTPFAGRGQRLGGKMDEAEARRRTLQHAASERRSGSMSHLHGASLSCSSASIPRTAAARHQGHWRTAPGGPGVQREAASYIGDLMATGPVFGKVWTAYLQQREAFLATPNGRTAPACPSLCSSVTIYTPQGKLKLERAVPQPDPREATLALKTVTVGDCRNSLLRSALGRAMRLRPETIQLVFAPNTPGLAEDVVLQSSEAVLRLLTRRKSH